MNEAPLYNAGLLVTTPGLYARSGLPAANLLAKLPGPDLVLARLPREIVRPRAFVAPPWFVASEAAAAARIRIPAVRKGAVALIEGGAPGPVAGSGGQVEVTRYRPEQVDLSVTAPAGGLSALVLNDAWYPGWSATLDGAPVPIRHANLLARGVLVPPGTHRVRFTFPVPVSLEVGAGVSLGSIATALLLLLVGRRSSRATVGDRAEGAG